MRKMTRWMAAAFVLAAALLAAGSGSAAPAGPRAQIEEANGKFAALLAKGDAAGLAAMYAAGGQLVPPNGDFVSGAPDIQKFWQGVMDAGIKSAKLTTLDVTVRGNVAAETGKYDMNGADGKALDSGKYIVVWKREGGRWKLYRDMWNTSMPAPTPAK